MNTQNEGTVTENTQGLDYFNRGHWLTNYQVKSSLRIRRSIFDWAMDTLSLTKDAKVLELGATPDTERGDSNCFVRWFLEKGVDVHVASIENIDNLKDVFHGLEVIQWNALPSLKDEFDLVVSSAVLEHVGDHAEEHIKQGLSLGENLLLTTPNRYHWMEFHTKKPLLHWFPRHIHRKVLRILGDSFWAEDANLRLYSKNDVYTLMERVKNDTEIKNVEYFFPRFWGMTSNITLLLSK